MVLFHHSLHPPCMHLWCLPTYTREDIFELESFSCNSPEFLRSVATTSQKLKSSWTSILSRRTKRRKPSLPLSMMFQTLTMNRPTRCSMTILSSKSFWRTRRSCWRWRAKMLPRKRRPRRFRNATIASKRNRQRRLPRMILSHRQVKLNKITTFYKSYFEQRKKIWSETTIFKGTVSVHNPQRLHKKCYFEENNAH